MLNLKNMLINKYIYFNGKFVLEEKAIFNIKNVGFLYGDGLFETMASYNGNIFGFDLHIERLFSSLNELRYNICFSKDFIKEKTIELLKRNGLLNSNAYLKIIVYRENYKEKFKFDFWSKPNLIIIARKLIPYPEEFYKNGIKIIQSSIKRTCYNNVIYRHKLLNYFENIYAKNEAYMQSADDALFVTKDKVVLECTSSNIFMVKNDIIYTPPITLNILPGITRKVIIDICKKNKIRVIQRKLHYYNLLEADEIFLTNSIAQILPVKGIDNHFINSNKNMPGEITATLIKEYKKLTLLEEGSKV